MSPRRSSLAVRIAFALVLGTVLVRSGQAAPAAPAAVSWKPIGPWSETVEAVALDPKNPKVVYAATRNGVFKSTDGAETWVRKTKGLPDIHALCVAVDPKLPSTVYVGAWAGGVFKSLDGGETWKTLTPTRKVASFTIEHGRVEDIALDPINPKNLMFTSLYKSTTGGATITEIGPDAFTGGARDVKSLTFDPKNPKVVYGAGTGDLMKTTDFGVTWKRLDYGVPSPAHAKVVAIHPKSGEVLLGTGYHGLYKSGDAGQTWELVGQGLYEKANVFAIAWDPNDAQSVYVAASLKSGDEATVWHSTDGGTSFEDVGKDLPYEKISSLAMDPTDAKILYAATPFSGVFKTTDGGRTWNEKSLGFQSSFRTIRAVAVASPGTLFATTYGAIYRSTDDGKTWHRLRAKLPKGIDYEFLAAGGDTKPLAIAGADDSKLMRSIDGGDTWDDAPRSAPLRCIAPDPTNPRAFYVCADSGGVFQGGDGAWRVVTDNSGPGFSALAVDPQNPQNLFAGTSSGLHKSVNGGKKWKEWKPFEKVSGGVVRPAKNRDVLAIAFDPKNAKTLYVATEEDGVFKSADGGETWAVAGLLGEKVSSFALDPSDPQHLAALVSDKGVFVSKDAGATWSDVSAGVVDEEKKKLRMNRVVFGPGSPAPLYLATDRGGIYVAK